MNTINGASSNFKLVPSSAAIVQSNSLETSKAKDKKLMKVCKEMEGYFVGMLLDEMQKSVPKDPMMGTGNQASIYQGMFDQAIGDEIGKTGSFGIADMLYKEFSPNLGR
jgi:Rod binding domain-containing protein